MATTNARRADITGFAALLGDSFASKVDLLSKIVQSNHYPSVGRYKERLLAKIISEYIPSQFSVATGFVLFANEAEDERAGSKYFDAMNMSSHTLSRQCDIIVYDASNYPVIFKDDDFVIVRPESTKAVIEVKGTLNSRELNDVLMSFTDFGRKWCRTQKFYQKRYQTITPKPSLQAMCWDVGRTKKGTHQLNGEKSSKQISKFYLENLNDDELTAFPVLSNLFLYNEWHVASASSLKKDPMVVEIGWGTTRGKFLRQTALGEIYEAGDRTIAALLASLQYIVTDQFNRFYSYPDEIRDLEISLEQSGFVPWISGMDKVRAINSDYIDGKLRHEVKRK